MLGQIADRLSSGEDARAGSGPGKWIAVAIGALLALVGLGVGAFVAWRDKRELARLRHAEVAREQEARITATAAAVATNDEAVIATRLQANQARARADAAAAALAAAKERYARDLAAIDRIRSWRDVDPGAR